MCMSQTTPDARYIPFFSSGGFVVVLATYILFDTGVHILTLLQKN